MTPNENNVVTVYIGTYTRSEQHVDGKGEGIYIYHLDLSSGMLSPVNIVASITSPAFLTVNPRQRALYAVNEVDELDGQPGGAVSAFAIDPATGGLHVLNRQPSGGTFPCHVSVDQSGAWVLAANYGSGSVIALPILSDGSLGPVAAHVQHHGSSATSRQESPHAHCVITDPTNHYLLAADLGIDRIKIYRLDPPHGLLTPNDPPDVALEAGAGPRHLDFHPNGRYLYCLNELNSTLSAFAYDAEHGTLHPIQTIATLPDDFRGTNYCAAVEVAPSGRFVYSSNRGHDSIAIFAIDQATGALTSVGYVSSQGHYPRTFTIDPTGKLLLVANQNTDTVVSFWINPQTGQLTLTGYTAHVPTPVCLRAVKLNG